MPPPTRARYNGTSRKLVLAFDIGTTYSGISYSILSPDEIPEIRGVTRFPAQEQIGGASKIPTIIYYDREGKYRAIGAEATGEGVVQTAEDEGWTKAEWFKLHLRPQSSSSSEDVHHRHLRPLPKNKSVVDLFGDFMRYLYKCAKAYIKDTHEDDNELWASLEERIDYVLTHPNGWEGPQQEQMRKAAVMAGLVPDTHAGRSRIRFVTEGEASLHFCMQNGLGTQALKNGEGILIIDAGGGTIDLSAYAQASPSKGISVMEIAPPACHFQGSFFVTSRARVFFEDLLRHSKFLPDIDNITSNFDKTTKITFRRISDPQFIKFGGIRDTDPELNIRSGQLKLPGKKVATFFEPSITCIVQAVVQQRKSATRNNISSVFLVGGFGASDWLYDQLKNSLEQYGLRFCRPDSHVNKAVADGAVSFYLDHFVAARMSKLAYGVECSIIFDHTNKEHQHRLSSIFTSPAGLKQLPGAFSVILHKGIQVHETTEFRSTFFLLANDRTQLEHVLGELKSYKGTSVNPNWLDINADMYSTLCYIGADTSQISKNLKPRQSVAGAIYYAFEFEVILLFGLTELKAQIAWKEEGREKRGEARIVYDMIQ